MKEQMHPLWVMASEKPVEMVARMSSIALDDDRSRLYKRVVASMLKSRLKSGWVQRQAHLKGDHHIDWDEYIAWADMSWAEDVLGKLNRCHDRAYALSQLLCNHIDSFLDYEDGLIANGTFAYIVDCIVNDVE